MPALARMLTAQEYFAAKNHRWHLIPSKTQHLCYMDFAEAYADYVVEHEKFIDRTGLANVEALENEMHSKGCNTVSELVASSSQAILDN